MEVGFDRTTLQSEGKREAPLNQLHGSNLQLLPKPENNHLLCKGKYHCSADLLFDWFGFSRFVELKL